MAKTGEKSGASGIYRSDCKDRDEMTHIENTVFPPCSLCHGAVNWILVRATVHRR